MTASQVERAQIHQFAARIGNAARPALDGQPLARALYRKQVIGGAGPMRPGLRRGGSDTHDGNFSPRARQMMHALPVVVAMQHQFGAAGGDDVLERAGVIQSAQRPRAAAMRRMMQPTRRTGRSDRVSSVLLLNHSFFVCLARPP